MERRALAVGWVLALLLGLTGCGASEGTSARPTATVTETATVTATPSVEIASPLPGTVDGDELPENSPTLLDESAQESPTSEPSSVGTARSGRPLGLNEAHAIVGQWDENRYEIADRSDVSGMGVEVTQCGDIHGVPELEYRLANRFSQIAMKISQANSSAESDELLTILVMANEEQIDIQRVAFNQVKTLVLPVAGVNALKLRFYLDDEDSDSCSYDSSVIAVIEDLVVT